MSSTSVVKSDMQNQVIATIIGCLIAMYIFKMLNPQQENLNLPLPCGCKVNDYNCIKKCLEKNK